MIRSADVTNPESSENPHAEVLLIVEAAERGTMTGGAYTRLWIASREDVLPDDLQTRVVAALRVADDQRWFQQRMEMAMGAR